MGWQACRRLSFAMMPVFFLTTPVCGQAVPNCASKDTLDIVKDLVVYWATDSVSTQNDAIGFVHSATSKQTRTHAACTVKVIDTKTSGPDVSLTYDVWRAAKQSMIKVRIGSIPGKIEPCDPLMTQALFIQSMTYCDATLVLTYHPAEQLPHDPVNGR